MLFGAVDLGKVLRCCRDITQNIFFKQLNLNGSQKEVIIGRFYRSRQLFYRWSYITTCHCKLPVEYHMLHREEYGFFTPEKSYISGSDEVKHLYAVKLK
jgi:hypothetical protein